LEAQKIKDFTGSHDDWNKWKSRTECAFSGSGYERVLEEEAYAVANPRLNKVVYSQLAAATVDGIAYHLVQRHETTKNGWGAWMSLLDWYDGVLIQNETAEGLRVKLDNLVLHSGVSGSEYVNKFLAWHRDLEKIPGEGMSKNHAVHLFLKNIMDPDYNSSVTYCRNTSATLDQCVSSIRKQERDLQQKRIEKRRMKATLRRMKLEDSSDDDNSIKGPSKRQKTTSTSNPRRTTTNNEVNTNSNFSGELLTTDRGLLRFKSDCWKQMTEQERDYIREFNSAVKHGESTNNIAFPSGITVATKTRRAVAVTPTPSKSNRKKKSVNFGLTESERDEDSKIE
jgi:hypothetical protein